LFDFHNDAYCYLELIMAKHRNPKGGKRRNRKEIRKQKGHVV